MEMLKPAAKRRGRPPKIESKVAVQGNEIKHMQEDMDEMKKDIEEIKKSISEIHKVLSEAKGGWKALIWAAGAGGAVVATLGTLYQILGSK
tara:strand:- start:1497 stop:1769 length:273 start_codon:yes stop_codon:yes gene_type:complete